MNRDDREDDQINDLDDLEDALDDLRNRIDQRTGASQLPSGAAERIDAGIAHAYAGLTGEGKERFRDATRRAADPSNHVSIAEAFDALCQSKYNESGMHGRTKEQQKLVDERVTAGMWPFTDPDAHVDGRINDGDASDEEGR